MAYDEDLALRVRTQMRKHAPFVEQKMFGGLGFLLDGNMCVGIWKNSLIARIGPEAYRSALQEANVREFDVTGRPMKGWVLVEADAVVRDETLHRWVSMAVQFVRTLPAKRRP